MGGERYTYNWFTHNAQDWPNFLAAMAGQPGLHFLEIGSFEGRSACWLLQNILTHESSRLTCIDLFLDAMGGEDESMPRVANPNAAFDQNIAATGAAHRVTKLRGASEDLLRPLPRSNYDFIYIDGSHHAPYVLSDAVLSWYVLKVGGLLCFDDYEWAPEFPPLERPQAGIDAFMSLYAGLFEVVSKGYQVTLRKTADLIPVP
jgi:predicted O-methyltransferase YrrM